MDRILIVDDEPNVRRMLGSLLRAEGFEVRETESGRAAMAEIHESEPDVLLLDLVMPGRGGLELLDELSGRVRDLPVIMMSGRASLADAVEATKRGAFHFLEKPLSPESVLLTLRSALELRRAREENRALAEQLSRGLDLIGRSPAIHRVRELVERFAPTDARIMIMGESGTGKELVAAAIHRHSGRAAGPFVRVNCAAIPRELAESELFGHEKGAFTGATARRRGRFEQADGGTLLLDEVGELGLEIQAKLLRVLEADELERVGGSEPIPVRVRVLAATNRDLQADMRAGRFREDLFFRLHVLPLHIPPLRARREDVPLLVSHFLRRNHERDGLHPPRLTDAALDHLQGHGWPGNVRELANIVERLTILHPGQVIGEAETARVLEGSASARPAFGTGGDVNGSGPLTERLAEFERALIVGALEVAGGNVAEAARRLVTDRANLYRRMRRLRIAHPESS